MDLSKNLKILAASLLCGALSFPASVMAWEPERSIEILVPSGPGGGADQMARLIASIIAKHRLAAKNVVVVNKGAGSGAEAYLEMKASRGDPHRLVVSLSSIFTAPLTSNLPFSWRSLTPVRLMAMDRFVLWVPEDSAHQATKDLLAAASSERGRIRMGGTGTKQEDQILTAAIQVASGATFEYVAMPGGGAVARALSEKAIDASVNNPIEAAGLWKAGKVRPLCVFDTARIPGADKQTPPSSWATIPTCKESGLDVSYQMMRGVFMPQSVTGAQVAYYENLLGRVTKTPEWKAFIEEGAYHSPAMSNEQWAALLESEEGRHEQLMRRAGFLSARVTQAAK